MIRTEPPHISIHEACYPGPYDGEDIITEDWGDHLNVIRRDAAVDLAYGILFLASEPTPQLRKPDRWEPVRAFWLVTGLVCYGWTLWTVLEFVWGEL